MKVLVTLAFFLSGAAGLIFETLWFRMASLTFGSSVWASSLVLSSFMGGLALGNGIAVRFGWRVRRPLLAYAALELLVGAFGLGLVLLFPHLPGLLAPLFRPVLDHPLLLNPLRFTIGFALLLIPTTAMGATLPLMVKALHRRGPGFGQALGRLYGWNTLGALVGAAACEEALIPLLGIAMSGAAAASLNAVAAVTAAWLPKSAAGGPLSGVRIDPPAAVGLLRGALGRLLAAAFLCGATLLALEVVWFRFLQLFVFATSRVFATMLVVVLAGIGMGGLAASLWLRFQPSAHRFLSHIALAAGLVTAFTYARFPAVLAQVDAAAHRGAILVLSAQLMWPVAFLSGVLFTFLGRAAFDRWREETGAVGWVTLANTLGAMVGAIAGGWVLLPLLGIETSIFVLALLYAAVAFLVPHASLSPAPSRRLAWARGVLGAFFLLAVILYPFGLMRNHHIPFVVRPWLTPESEIVAFREGLTETIIYLEHRYLGVPHSYRLLTNSFSMSGTNLTSRRYMKHFVYWPLAFHPEVKKSLLISYGVGMTAKALTDSREIEQIDIVDISKEILKLNHVVYPEPESLPLNDPRVNVYIEDGRFYLLTAGETYDLITAEPPPLKVPGVVNLYTQEYFALLRARLNDGGYTTYWLPVDLLSAADAKSVIRGFCNVFEDCSLWRGTQMQLVLVGSRGARGPIDESRFSRQWRDPTVARELEVLGFEVPELLLTTFVADADHLRELAEGSLPLVDNYPYRLSPELHGDLAFHYDVLRPEAVSQRYRGSRYLQSLLPARLFQAGLAYYPVQEMMDQALDHYHEDRDAIPLVSLDRLLTQTSLRTPVLWLMGDILEPSGVIDRLVEENGTSEHVEYHLGIREMGRRNYLQAAEHFRRARVSGNGDVRYYHYGILALGYAGRAGEAEELSEEFAQIATPQQTDPAFWDFCARKFGLPNPYG